MTDSGSGSGSGAKDGDGVGGYKEVVLSGGDGGVIIVDLWVGFFVWIGWSDGRFLYGGVRRSVGR